MNIKVLVSCCSDYGLKETTEEVIKELGADATVEKVSDMQTIMAYGVMKAPAIVINEKVKAMGRAPSKAEIKQYIQDELNA
jgi:Predicted dithiol-disulfide isomerase involved in polyketide biosynthesis